MAWKLEGTYFENCKSGAMCVISGVAAMAKPDLLQLPVGPMA